MAEQNTENRIDITQASTEQLKALAYDHIVQLQHVQKIIAAIEQELAKRQESASGSVGPVSMDEATDLDTVADSPVA